MPVPSWIDETMEFIKIRNLPVDKRKVAKIKRRALHMR